MSAGRVGLALVAAVAVSAGLARAAPVASAPAPAAPAPVDDAAFGVELPAKVELVRGAVAQVALTLRGAGRYRVTSSGVLVELEASSPGVALRQRRYQRSDAQSAERAADAVTFSLALRGEAAGEHQVRVRLRFWVCAPRLCLPIDETRLVAVVVAEPPPPAAPEPPPPAPAPKPKRAPAPVKK